MPEIAKPLTYSATMRTFERRLAALERRPAATSAIQLGLISAVVPGGAPGGADLIMVIYSGRTRPASHSPDFTGTAGDPVVLWVRPDEVVILGHG